MSEKSAFDFRQPNGRFAKGNPGGPGRPRARDRIDALDQIVAEKGTELIAAAFKAAEAGNVKAIEMLLGRIWPARRGRPAAIEASEIATLDDLLAAGNAVTEAVLNGDVTPEQAAAVASLLIAQRRLFVSIDLDRRVTEMVRSGEEARKGK